MCSSCHDVLFHVAMWRLISFAEPEALQRRSADNVLLSGAHSVWSQGQEDVRGAENLAP